MKDVVFALKISYELRKKFKEKLFSEKYFWGKEKKVMEELIKKFIEGKCDDCINLEGEKNESIRKKVL